MPTLDTTSPPATHALLQWRARRPMPTHLSSVELRSLGRDVWRRSVVSARTTNAAYLDEVASVLDDMLAGKIEMATAKMRLYFKLKELGYDPETGFPDDMGKVPPAERGSLRDLSSQKRLTLVLETNRRIAAGYGRMMQGNEPYALYAWPAWELVRIYDRNVPRGSAESHSAGWARRWHDAGGPYTEGRMIALKDSPVWQALGNGAGGYEDGLGNPFPPFAFNSGMGWEAVRREECLRLGIITGEDTPEATEAELVPGDEQLDKFLATMTPDMRAELRRELDEGMRQDRAILDAEDAPIKNGGFNKNQLRDYLGQWVDPAKLAKGTAAVAEALTGKDVWAAVEMPEGVVDLRWGNDGEGVKHILKRASDRIKKFGKGPTGEEVMAMMPKVLLLGKPRHFNERVMSKEWTDESGMTWCALLAKKDFHGQPSNHWLLSGYDLDEAKRGYRK